MTNLFFHNALAFFSRFSLRRLLLPAALLHLMALPAAAVLHVVALEVEQGTYQAGDPVPMYIVVANTGTSACGSFVVDVHLTPDGRFRTANDHLLTRRFGPGLEPGETYAFVWVQRMPGNLTGTFFVDAEVYTQPGASPTCEPRVASAFLVETAKITLLPLEHPETDIVSVTEGGFSASGNSETPSISRDGRWVAFASDATNLGALLRDEDGNIVVDDDGIPVGTIGNNHHDIFIRDQWTGELERITIPVAGGDSNGPSHLPRLSRDADARWVVFHSRATNLTTDPLTNNAFDVFLRDRQTKQTILLSRAHPAWGAQAQPLRPSRNASISADGKWVVFESEAENLLPPGEDTNGLTDIFLLSTETGEIRRVNVVDGTLATQALGGESRWPRISADGRHIVFESRASNLVPGAKPGLWQVYVHDRDANHSGVFDEPGGVATRRLSVAYDHLGNPLASDGHGMQADLSADGRFVTFMSEATNLVAEPAQGAIVLSGRPEEAVIRFQDNIPGLGRIGFVPDRYAKGTILFNDNPADGHFLRISDGVSTVTFEFDAFQTGVAAGRVPVPVGATRTITRNQLVSAINSRFHINEEQSLLAEPVGDFEIGLTNYSQGETGNNQPINAINAPTLEVTGMGTIPANRAVVTVPNPGDELEIDNNRTPPVTVRFYSSGDADPTNLGNRLIGVEIGRTAKETSQNLSIAFQELGYHAFTEFHLPGVPDYLLPPFLENPVHGTSHTFRRGDVEEDDFLEETFFFVDDGPQFDPDNPRNVPIEETPEATRGNLIRAITTAGFDFLELPSLIQGTGGQFAFGTFTDDPPPDGRRIIFYPDNLVHPRVVFEFRENLDDLSPDAHFGVHIGSTGWISEGNLLQAIHLSGLPWLVTEEPMVGDQPDPYSPLVTLKSLIGAGDGNIAFNFFASNPGKFDLLVSEGEDSSPSGGSINLPRHGAFLTLDDGLHEPVIFEFTADGRPSDEDHVPVRLGVNAPVTLKSLIVAINETESLDMMALPGDDELSLRLINGRSGPTVDPIATLDVASIGGSLLLTIIPGRESPAPGETFTLRDRPDADAVVFRFVDVVTGATGEILLMPDLLETRDNIIEAIKDSGLMIEAVPATEDGHPAVRLVHMVPGPGGNIPIQTSSNPSFEVRGMSGGGNVGSGVAQVYLVDRDANDNGIFDQVGHITLERVSQGQLEDGGNRASLEPTVSDDGRFVAFKSQATNLLPLTVVRSDGEIFDSVPGSAFRGGGFQDTTRMVTNYTVDDSFSNIYFFDRHEGHHRRVDVNRFGEAFVGNTIRANFPDSSRAPAMSTDGRFIVFESDAEAWSLGVSGLAGDGDAIGGGLAHGPTNRHALDRNAFRDVFVHDLRFVSDEAPFPVIPGKVTLLPLPGAASTITVGVPVYLTAEVSDLQPDREIVAVQFFINGELAGTATGPALPGTRIFSIAWAAPLQNTYNVTALAIDNRGRQLPLSNMMALEALRLDGAGPAITITSPQLDPEDDAAFFSLTNRSEWPLAALATSAQHGIRQVEFFIRSGVVTVGEGEDEVVFGSTGGVSIGLATEEPANGVWRLLHDFTGMTTGLYVVTAVAQDNAGNHAVSGGVTILVTAGIGQPPQDVRLILNKTNFVLNESIPQHVTAMDVDGRIVSVHFFTNGIANADTDDNPNPATEPGPFTYFAQFTVAGTYNLYAVATDNFGNRSMSNVVQITVSPIPAQPTVLAITSPADGDQFTVGISGESPTGASPVPIRVNASVAEGSINLVEILLGNEVIATLTSAPYRFNWLADTTGQLVIRARITDSFGRQWISAGVSILVTPVGVIVGNPSAPGNNTGFVTQMYLDLLSRSPSTGEFSFFVNQLAAETMTRGQVVQDLFVNPDFELRKWVITAYYTVIGLPPTREQLDDGVALLAGGDTPGAPGTPDDTPPVAGPARMSVLVSELLNSDDFWVRNLRPRRLAVWQDLEAGGLFHVIWRDNLRRSEPGISTREANEAQIRSFGGVFWTTSVVVSPQSPPISRQTIEATALILLLLDREEVSPAEVASLMAKKDPIDHILNSAEFLSRFDESGDFFGLGMAAGFPDVNPGWLGLFRDDHFDYQKRQGLIDHKEHGWLWAAGLGEPNGIWFWDYIQNDWIWSRSDQYPFFYSHNKQRWLWYHKGGKPASRFFYDYGTGTWGEVK